jgi:DNA-binding CsgD family transcriptional regulator
MRATKATLLPRTLAESLESGQLIGRDAPLAELELELTRAARDGGRAAVISGEAGVGKTRLVAELASRAVNAGRRVLYASCQRGAGVPYGPFVEALRGLAASLTGLAEHHARRLATLLPDLPATPIAVPGEDELERLRLFEAVAAAIALLAAPAGLLLIVDDLNWAQGSTLAMLWHLATRLPELDVLLVATRRQPDADRDPNLDELVHGIGGVLATRRMHLAGLDDADVRALVSNWSCRPTPATLASELRDLTDGNPFFLRATLEELGRDALLDDNGQLRDVLPRDARALVARDILHAVDGRLAELPGDARALLTAGAVLGQQFSWEEARIVARLERDPAVDALEAASALGLVRQIGGGGAGAQFAHALVRAAIERTLSPSRLELLHLRAGEAIEAAPRAASRSAELARHFDGALAIGGAERAARYAHVAAADAFDQLAFEEAAAALEIALRALAAQGAGWRERYEDLVRLGLARYRAYGAEAGVAAFAEAAALAAGADDGEAIAAAALGPGLERYLREVGVPDPETVALLEQALAALPPVDSRLRGAVLCALALERLPLDRIEVRRARTDMAEELALRLDDTEARLEAQTVAQVVLWHPSETERLLAGVDELTLTANKHGRLDLAMHLHCTAVGYAFELGRRDKLDAQLAAAHSAAQRLGATTQLVRVEALEIMLALAEGRIEEARVRIDRVLPSMTEGHAAAVRHVSAVWEFVLARELGGLEQLRDALGAAAVGAPSRALLAEVCARSGDVAAARIQLARLRADGFANVHDDFTALGVLTTSASAAALAGEREVAAELFELLLPWADRHPILGLVGVDRPVGHTLGLLLASLGDGNAALEHFEQAADAAAALGFVPFEAHARYELGATLRRLGRPRQAREALGIALDLAARYGGALLVARARAELVAAGARPRRARQHGAEALTPAEMRVAHLAARGMTNAQIARALVLAQRTVETHLTRTYRKLGIASRAELVGGLAGANPDLGGDRSPSSPPGAMN